MKQQASCLHVYNTIVQQNTYLQILMYSCLDKLYLLILGTLYTFRCNPPAVLLRVLNVCYQPFVHKSFFFYAFMLVPFVFYPLPLTCAYSVSCLLTGRGTGYRHAVLPWPTSPFTGKSHKLVIPAQSPDKKVVQYAYRFSSQITSFRGAL